MPIARIAARMALVMMSVLVAWTSAHAQVPSKPAIESVNIMDVQPEASQDKGYLEQSNGERAAVQPGNNAPFWREVGKGSDGYSSLPKRQAPEAGNLIQPFVTYPLVGRTNAGEAWRQLRNRWILPYGGALMVITLVALAILYAAKGPIGHEHGAEPQRIERFTPFERAAHWTNAFAFCILAISGIVMAFSKWVLPPVNGSAIYGTFVFVLKNLHNFVGPLFVVSLVVVIITFIKDNFFIAKDVEWLVKAGGMLNDKPVPSPRFNAGEKLVFWFGALLFGLIVVASGLVLDNLVPGVGELRSEMQWAHMIHATAALTMIAIFIGHIYMGTIGMRNAYRAMRDGYVSEGWAREHHSMWFDDIKAGKVPAQRSGGTSTPMPHDLSEDIR
jgi:formate dehydrogenase subunit gamma